MAFTSAQIASFRRVLKQQRKKRQRTAGVETPLPNTVLYLKDLLTKIVEPMRKEVEGTLGPWLQRNENKWVVQDSVPESREILGRLENMADELEELAEQIAQDMAQRGNVMNRAAFVNDIQKAIGINVSSILADAKTRFVVNASIDANVKLIKSIPQQYLERIKKAVTQGIETGIDAFSLQQNIMEAGDITARRARVIARDQTSKLNSALNQTRQKDIGVDKYTWRTSKDERVRKEHRKNNGKKFSWDKPPAATGHPGKDVQCRCTAEPDLDRLLERLGV